MMCEECRREAERTSGRYVYPSPEEILMAMETTHTMGLLKDIASFRIRAKFGADGSPVAVAETFRYRGRIEHGTEGQPDFPHLDAARNAE